MVDRKKKKSTKNMGGFWFEEQPSLDEARRILQANKYEHDDFFSVPNRMSRNKPEYPFLVPLRDWSEILRDDISAFSLLCPEALEILFQKDQNPLYAWRAYQNCREHKIPIPDWVLAYLDSSAGKLLDIEFPEQPAHETYAALGLNQPGSGTEYGRFYEAEKKLNAVCRVIVLRRNKEDSELPRAIDIYAQVADEYNVTIDTIQKWCKENCQLFNLPQKSC
tara:strand:- start:24 stop:686 length:663 start_codon:yes stop_codon:yes gene_type:complete